MRTCPFVLRHQHYRTLLGRCITMTLTPTSLALRYRISRLIRRPEQSNGPHCLR